MTTLLAIGQINIGILPNIKGIDGVDPRLESYFVENGYDSAYARKNMCLGKTNNNVSDGTLISDNVFQNTEWDATSGALWIHWSQDWQYNIAAKRPFSIKDSDGKTIYSFCKWVSGSTGYCTFYSYNDAGEAVTVEYSEYNAREGVCDVDISFNPITNKVSLYVNGALRFEGDLDCNRRSAGTKAHSLRWYATWIGEGFVISQLIVANERTLGWKLKTLHPTAQGTHAEWVNDVANINGAIMNYTTSVDSDVAAKQSYVHSQVQSAIQEEMVIETLYVTLLADAIGAVTKVGALARVGGTDYNLPSTEMLDDKYITPYAEEMSVNPATGNPWTFAELNATEFGFRSE
ncbi:hypothetical protein HOU79_gp69 [Vibrio phage 1.224.A._10N.261.48.B1]|uniref:Uncharacterized protein n=1 Tax=Vibrio phage 1.224.A._10N.261.48.B1 TaxID=1881226 RepID=A0A2I7RRY7_9CAUD|nr:hypothetical protein HOU79_gp69 [Vibrio phage 1.224.A._10N.261.48.B1]AUR96404.1 hypothetical protein NVP1224A_37 [Vibrio phage 1.224.A._10N.261.48.B1]